MAFTSVESNGGLMREGEYEVYVADCKYDQTKTGTPVVAFDFVVRADVAQAYQGKHIFKNFYQDDATGLFPAEKIGKYANALGVEKGVSFDLDDLIGLNCIVVIKHWTNDRTGETKSTIFYTKPSDAQPYTMSAPAPAGSEDDDGELPF